MQTESIFSTESSFSIYFVGNISIHLAPFPMTDEIQRIFVIGLKEAKTGGIANDYTGLNEATLKSFTKIIDKLAKTSNSKTLDFSKLLCKNVVESGVLKLVHDEVCTASIEFLTKVLSIHVSHYQMKKVELKRFWTVLLFGGLETDFEVIRSGALNIEMKSALKSLQLFYSKLDSLA